MSGEQVQRGVAILGAGRFAEALTRVLGLSGADVRIWLRDADKSTTFGAAHPTALATTNIEEAVDGAALIFFAVPASAVQDVSSAYGDHARGDHIVVHACRGVAEGFKLPHELIRSQTCVRKIGALGGPLHARELTSGRPIAAVIASRYNEVVDALKGVAKGTPVQIHPSNDVIGVEVAGAISNVSALASGMADALGLGETARGILLTHGLVEAQRLGCAIGAQAGTFTGLAGVGDLIPRGVTSTDRHLEVGRRLVKGDALEVIVADADGEVEGLATAVAAAARAAQLGLSLPLINAVAGVLSGDASPGDVLDNVLQLDDIELGHGLRPGR